MNRPPRALAILVGAVACLSCAALTLLLDGGDERARPPHSEVARDDLAARRVALDAPRSPGDAGPIAVATEGAAARPTGTVRLAGRLVAERLEAAWVHAPQVPSEDEDPNAAFGRSNLEWRRPEGATPVEADGAFALDLTPGRHVVLAGALGCATRVEAIDVTADLEGLVWTLAWTAPATLEVQLLTATREPLAGAQVELELEASQLAPRISPVGVGPWPQDLLPDDDVDEGEAWAYRTVDLDGAGLGRLTLPAGTYDLGVQSLGWPRPAPVFGEFVGASWSDATVTLTPGGLERVTIVTRQRSSPLPCTVVVHVRDTTGRPVAGALVGSSRFQPSQAAHDQVGEDGHAARTGPDGAATLVNVGVGGVWLVARGDGYSGRAGPLLLDTPGARVSAEVVLSQVEPLGDLVVRVVARESGEPVEGPWLSDVWRHDQESAEPAELVAPGVLQLRDVEAGPYQRRVHAPGRAAEVVSLTIEPRRVHDVTIRLAPGATIAGRIVSDYHGEATLLCRRAGDLDLSQGFLAGCDVNDDGSFRLEGLPRDVELALGLQLERWFVSELTVEAPAHDLELRLPAEPQLSEIVVLGADGEPQAGALVAITQPGWNHLWQPTDHRGITTLRGTAPPHSTAAVEEVSAPVLQGGRTVLRRLESAKPPPAERLPRDVLVRGVVVDASNAPVPFALAGLRGDRFNAVTCDAQGAFTVLADVGPEWLWAWRADRAATALEVDVPAGGLTGVVLRLPDGVRLRVRAPATVATVHGRRWAPLGPADVTQSVRSADGAFDLGLVAPGPWTFELRDAERRRIGSPIQVDVRGPDPVVVALP